MRADSLNGSLTEVFAAGIKPESVVCLTQFGKAITTPYKRAARPQDREFATRWFAQAQSLLREGLLRAHPYKTTRGWEAVIDGLELVRKGQVARCKLVYSVASQ